jgi:hypothetical protein
VFRARTQGLVHKFMLSEHNRLFVCVILRPYHLVLVAVDAGARGLFCVEDRLSVSLTAFPEGS